MYEWRLKKRNDIVGVLLILTAVILFASQAVLVDQAQFRPIQLVFWECHQLVRIQLTATQKGQTIRSLQLCLKAGCSIVIGLFFDFATFMSC